LRDSRRQKQKLARARDWLFVTPASTNTGQSRRRHGLCSMLLLPAVSGSLNRLAFHAPLLLEPRKHLAHLFPELPLQPGYFKRRRRLAETLEWLMGVFASQSLGAHDDLLLIDSTPVECARSRDTVTRSALGDAADYGWCASHSRFFWGFRLHAIFSPDGTPRALELCSPKLEEREIGLVLLDRCQRHGGETLLGDKGYASRTFAAQVAERDTTFIRPQRKDEHGPRPHLAPIRQRIESIFWTCKDLLTLERHGARTLAGLRERVLARFCCLAAAISLNHQLGRPSRALVNYCA